MTPWVHRVTYPATLLQYIGDMILTLLIAAAGIVLLMIGVFQSISTDIVHSSFISF